MGRLVSIDAIATLGRKSETLADGASEVNRIRIDVMSNLRGVDLFDHLWQRRTLIADNAGNEYNLLSLADLVQAKRRSATKIGP
jgi:hypothetical protein